MQDFIIFTDLDGTLLNHHTYEYEVVMPLLARLEELRILVVLNSSKTLAELTTWRKKLQLHAPVIAENGGVILYPDDSTAKVPTSKTLIGTPYATIRSHLVELRNTFAWQFAGFGDWSVAEVMAHTGLNKTEAEQAKNREVSEPILWLDSEANFALFKTALAQHHLVLKKGGRFYHVMGQHDKADAMRFLMQHPQFNQGKNLQAIALGDGQNDLAMLQSADIAVVLPAASGESLVVKGAYYPVHEAPHGWVDAIESILKQAIP